MSRIRTNVAALNAHRNLSKTNMALERSIQKLSSGFRINRAGDDAAGLAIANRLRSDVRAYSQTARNGVQARAVLNIADGALDSVSGILDRMKELAAQAASDNVSNTQRTTLHAEFDALRSEITRIVATTSYQGSALLDGTFTGSFLVSASGAYATDDLVTVSALDVQVATLGIDAANGDLTTSGGAQTTLTNLDGAIAVVAGEIGDLGAAENRIEISIANTNTAIENISAAESVIRDADLAFEMVDFTKNQILQQAGTAMLAQANAAPQSILSLLAG